MAENQKEQTVVVEVWGIPAIGQGTYGLVKSKKFNASEQREINRFVKKWSKRRDTRHRFYDIEQYEVHPDDADRIMQLQTPTEANLFIMRRFMERM